MHSPCAPDRGHLLFGGAGLAPERPEHRLEEGGLAGAVWPVYADQARRQHQVELVFEHPVIAQVYAVDQHVRAPGLARRLDRFFEVLVAEVLDPVPVEARQVLVREPGIPLAPEGLDRGSSAGTATSWNWGSRRRSRAAPAASRTCWRSSSRYASGSTPSR